MWGSTQPSQPVGWVSLLGSYCMDAASMGQADHAELSRVLQSSESRLPVDAASMMKPEIVNASKRGRV